MKVKTAGELQDTPLWARFKGQVNELPIETLGMARGGVNAIWRSDGAQVFKWVCGLNAVNGQPWAGGLLR